MVERVRNLALERPYSGRSAEEVRLFDAVERSVTRALPEWVRGSVLLGADETPSTVGVVGFHFDGTGRGYYIPHTLGRPHKGWIVVRPVYNLPDVYELQSDDSDYRAALAETHLQLWNPTVEFWGHLLVW